MKEAEIVNRRKTMKTNYEMIIKTLLIVFTLGSSASVFAVVNSGSTGADGPFAPTVNTQLTLPPDGIFNFTTVNIPVGVTVTFQKNTTNTPVTILATGDVTLAGVIDVSGQAGPDVGAAGDGNVGDDGLPGLGGPGGFNGGQGAAVGRGQTGGTGLGPGGGGPGQFQTNQNLICGGGGGGFGTDGLRNIFFGRCPDGAGTAGPSYGVPGLLPLIGGSGGGGGAGGDSFVGGGGGGGGGAILIASSGTVNVTGTINASGGKGASLAGSGSGGAGGGGSGGAIRIVATTISGEGPIMANLGARGLGLGGENHGGNGGLGRIRFETETITRVAVTTPTFSFSQPQEIFVAGLPGLRITRVAGVDAPLAPTGSADITLPEATPNPVTVEFATNGVPLGNTITLTVTPPSGATTSAISNALVGTVDNATASVSVNLPTGPSTLSAAVSFTVTASIGDAMKNFAKGERVERVVLAAVPGKGSTTTLITASGKEYSYPSLMPAMN